MWININNCFCKHRFFKLIDKYLISFAELIFSVVQTRKQQQKNSGPSVAIIYKTNKIHVQRFVRKPRASAANSEKRLQTIVFYKKPFKKYKMKHFDWKYWAKCTIQKLTVKSSPLKFTIKTKLKKNCVVSTYGPWIRS